MGKYKFNPFSGRLDIAGGSTIGSPVIGGINNTVLYIDSSGNLASNLNFTYDASTVTITTPSNTASFVLNNSSVANIGNTNSILFYQKDIIGLDSEFGEIRVENVQDATPTSVFRFFGIDGAPKELFRTWTTLGVGGLEAIQRLGVNIGALPAYRLQAIETDSSAISAVSFSGYSDGGFATKNVVRISNEWDQTMVMLGGSNLALAGDYGSMNFYGTAEAAQNLYSFGDLNWVNDSTESSGDKRTGTMRVYRDGAWNQGTFQLVLRNGGSFTTPLSIKYTGQLSLDQSVAPTVANQFSQIGGVLQFHDGTAARSLFNKLRKNSAGTIFSRPQINLIEGSNVTLTVADDAGNGEIDVTIAASGGGGGATWTETEIDFGAGIPKYEASFTIVDGTVSGTSKIVIVPSGKAATGRTADDWEWDGINLAANPGTGQFTVYAVANPGPIKGPRKIQYSVA